MVTAVVETAAELLAFSVKTLLPDVGLVFHEAVTPSGNADVTARVTFPLKPSASVTVTVVELELPWLTETTLGDPSIQKPGTWGPANSSIRFCPFALPHPVTRSYPEAALNHTGWLLVSLSPEVTS